MRHKILLLTSAVGLAVCGCQTTGPLGVFGAASPAGWFGRSDPLDAPPDRLVGDAVDGSTVVPASAEMTVTEKASRTLRETGKLLTGRETENLARGRELYREADAAFKDAAKLPVGEREKDFHRAAKLFVKASDASPGTALEQDARFMQGESLFFANRFSEATEVYQKLQKQFPRNRHNDPIAARLFSISRYWIDTVKADDSLLPTVNLFDRSRPRLDVDGHAIRVLDQIRYDDPTGRLADDATMAAAAEYIRQEKFFEADEFLADLRETFTDSEHLFHAHLLGIRTKLEIYAGPRYSDEVLGQCEKLIEQTRMRFPDKMSNPEYAELVARSARTVTYHRAQKKAEQARFRERRREYRAATQLYQELLDRYGDTPQADEARARLQEIATLPPVPTQRLAWLTKIFPDSRAAKPLDLVIDQNKQDPDAGGNDSDSGTMLR